MVGKIIRKTMFCIVCILLFSCQNDKKQNKDNIKNIIDDYLETLMVIKSFKEKDKSLLLLKVKTDSLENYKSYRVYLEKGLLNTEKQLPNKVSTKKGIKIAYFTEKVNGDFDSIRNVLLNKSFYHNNLVTFNSNYPEWILLRNMNSDKQILIKDMSYSSLKDVIKKYGKKIN
ncbi:hypothetical protein TPENAI_10535 [Tenacibaculum litopenaei]|jgi:hypothetical protein|uniref:hypothetical protein n=1 Tax=Tenacibaculum litopenaei TaxID=396016 RepID=UPI0038952D55